MADFTGRLVDRDGNLLGTAANPLRIVWIGAPEEQDASTINFLELGDATYGNLQDWMNIVQSGGRISGGALSAHSPANGTVDISAFKGFVKVTDSDIAETRFFDLVAQSGVALTDNQTNYIYIEYNAGNPRVVVTTDRSTIRQTDQFTLGRAFRNGTSVEVLQSGINVFNRARKIHERWIDTFGGLSYASGILTSCTGLKPAITAGVLYAGSNKLPIDALDCNTTGTFGAYYYNPTTASWVFTTGNTALSATQYNNTSTGTGLANLSANRYAVHWLYVCPEGEVYVLFGQSDYTLANAQAAAAPALVPNYLSQWAKLASKIIIARNAATVYSITQAWATQFPVQSTAEHNDLTGLQGGTTDQYYHVTAAQSAGVVVGPASATDNAIARYDATTGKLIQDSLATVSDTGSINVPAGQTFQIGGQALYPNGIISPTMYNRYTGQPSTLTLSSDIERRFFKDDFSVDSLAQYTQTGTVAIASGAVTLETTEKIIKALQTGDTTGKWDTVCKFTTTYSTDQSCKLYFGATSYLDIQRKTGNAIYLQLTVNGSSLIAATDTSATLADDTYGRASVTYDGTNYQMLWNGAAVGSATAGTVPTTPSIGVLATASTIVLDELSYIPSISYTDPCSADLTARFATVSGTAAAFNTDKYDLVANTDSKYRLKSYQFGSGSRLFKFTLPASGSDGDYVNMRFCSIGDMSLGYGVGVIRASGAWNAYTVKDVTGTTGAVITDLADGDSVYIEVERSSEHGVYWYYIYETTKPTAPTGKIFDASYQYGYSGIVCHSASGSKTFVLNSIEVRAHSLIGETNVPASEENFYFKDDFAVDSIGRYVYSASYAKYISITSGEIVFDATHQCGLLTPMRCTDLDISVNAIAISTISSGQFGIIFHNQESRITTWYTGSRNGYAVVCYNGKLRLIKQVGSTQTTLLQGPTTILADTSYTIRIVTTTSGVSVYLNGALEISLSDVTFTSGYIGLGSYTTGSCKFDNLTISGTRVYNKPMLRGCQIGEMSLDGLTSTPCTRFVDDCNWDTSAEWTDIGSGTFAYNSAIGRFYSSSAADIAPYFNGGKYGSGVYTWIGEWASGSNYFIPVWGWQTGTVTSNYPNIAYSFYWRQDTGAWQLRKLSDAGVETIITSGTKTCSGGTHTISVVWNTTTGSIAVYIDNEATPTTTATDTTITTAGYVGYICRLNSGSYFKGLYVNALESESNTGISLSLGGVPHGARYNTTEYAVKSFVNAARYGEYKAITAAKTTDYGNEDIEVYLKNSTDSSNITNDASETVAIALTDNNYTNVTKDVTLNADDQLDTITMQVRRKTAATDNTPACFVDFLALIPTVEV